MNREKTKIVALIWDKSNGKYTVNELLSYLKLKRSTYYYELKQMSHPDKYAELKLAMIKIFKESKETYGYRRLWMQLTKMGYKYCPDTIRRLTGVLGIKVSLYSKHASGYSSYKGIVGRIAQNILKQKFNETIPYRVLHTDITQVKLLNGSWGYISSVIDEASKEVLGFSVNSSPNMKLVKASFINLRNVLKGENKVIVHSDQGWHYQNASYRKILANLKCTQSMSRKGNCHDNAPMESWFNLLKREYLNGCNIKDIDDLRAKVNDYVYWFNNIRISGKTKGLTPVEYRNQTLGL